MCDVYYALYASSIAQEGRIHLMIIKKFILVTAKISLSLTGTILQKPCFYQKPVFLSFFFNQLIHGKSCSQKEEGSFY